MIFSITPLVPAVSFLRILRRHAFRAVLSSWPDTHWQSKTTAHAAITKVLCIFIFGMSHQVTKFNEIQANVGFTTSTWCHVYTQINSSEQTSSAVATALDSQQQIYYPDFFYQKFATLLCIDFGVCTTNNVQRSSLITRLSHSSLSFYENT